jgi:ElaB/YqjD/DUF883 family membrane-anchored ribosome-binding protein
MANTSSQGPTGTGGSQGSLRDKGEQIGAAAGRKIGEQLGKAQEAAASAGQKAQDAASGVAQRAQDVASNVATRAQEFASTAADKTDEALSTVGEKMTSLAGTIRQSAPHEGALGTAATAVANRLQAGGHYLQEHGVGDMAEDMAAFVRRYPLQSIFIGFGVGCLVGMACTRR